MGVLKQGILGGFRGKVGSVIGTGWKGKAVIKAMPLSVANPRTAGQVSQRGKFSLLVELSSLILAAIIKPLWDRFAVGMSGYNAFMSANRNAFKPDNTIDYAKLQISKGKMLKADVLFDGGTADKKNYTLKSPVGDKFALPTDKIYALSLDATGKQILYSGMTSVVRGSGATVAVPITYKDATAASAVKHTYFSYLRADGSEVSNSKWAD